MDNFIKKYKVRIVFLALMPLTIYVNSLCRLLELNEITLNCIAYLTLSIQLISDVLFLKFFNKIVYE